MTGGNNIDRKLIEAAAKASEIALIEQTKKVLGTKFDEMLKMVPSIFEDGKIALRKDTLNAFVEGCVFIESLGQKAETNTPNIVRTFGGQADASLYVKGTMMAVLLEFRNSYEADLAEKAKAASIL